MKARDNRDEIVIATKYTIGYKNTDSKVKLKVRASRGSAAKRLTLVVGELPRQPPEEPDTFSKAAKLVWVWSYLSSYSRIAPGRGQSQEATDKLHRPALSPSVRVL